MKAVWKYPVVFLVLWPAIIAAGCTSGLEYTPSQDVLTGQAARASIGEALPASASDFYVFDGGSFGGSIYYASFACASDDDCWAAVAALRGPDSKDFRPVIHSEYAVNIHGPSFYWPELETEHWKISTDANGASYESAQQDRRMDFWAIDFDRKRVFFHHESGGFPADPPSVRYR